MPAVTPYSLRADFAAKLSQLETGTAVLERDARKERAGLIERGYDFSAPEPKLAGLQAAWTRALGPLARIPAAIAAPYRWLRRTAPYIAAALRIARRCVLDAIVCTVAAGVALLPFALAILLLAPPE